MRRAASCRSAAEFGTSTLATSDNSDTTQPFEGSTAWVRVSAFPSGSVEISMLVENAHQHTIGMGEIFELVAQLVGPFGSVEEVVSEPPDDH